MDDLLAEFVAETRDMLAALSGEIVAWEADPADRARLDTIFRFVHTVKGNCGFFDFPRLEALSHAAEDALADVREGRREPDTRLVNAVLATLDRIEAMTLQIDRGQPIGESGDDDLIEALSAVSDDDIGVLKAKAGPMPGESAAVAVAEQRTIRLPVELIDQVMSGVSEMVLARNDLARRIGELGEHSGLAAPFGRLSGLLSEVRDAITRTRMRRIEGLFGTFPRLVRDLSAELGKQVLVELESGEVELDREMIELIRDPLMHIIRNAIDHGIEPPAARLAAGKHEAGIVTVSARQSGNTILIGIQDDGRGIDCDRLLAKAVEAGIVAPERAAGLTRVETIELIFEPGLSTAHRVTAISGRGVGMDVVRSNIEKFGGTLEIDTSLGEGTRFLISVPLTLSILPSLTVAAGGQTFAIPRSYVEEIVSGAAGGVELAQVGDRRLLTFRDRRLPCISLGGALGIAGAPQADLFVILRLGWGDLYALEVERVFDHQELVIKPLPPEIMACGLFVGCTQLDDGLPVLVLDVASLGYANGIPRELRRQAPVKPAPAAAEAGLEVIVLTALDGVRRALPMRLVEQVEQVPAAAVRRTARHAQVVLHGDIVPLAGLPRTGAWPDPLPVLRLTAEAGGIAYAAREVLDIERLAIAPRTVGADTAPLALLGGDPVEVIDGEALRRAHAKDAA